MKVFVSLKVPRGDAELEKFAALSTKVIRQTGHEPFIATHESALQGFTDPKDFMPFVRQHAVTSGLMIVLYHPELRGGLVELGLAYAQNIPIWLCHKPNEKVSSSARGCADLTIEYNSLDNLQNNYPPI